MAEPIINTRYEWSRWRGWVVLYERTSLKPLWGLCIFCAGYMAVMSALIAVLLITVESSREHPPSPIWPALVSVVAAVFAYLFVKAYRLEKGVLWPVYVWRAGRGVQLGCKTYRTPQPTGMGGTLPGYPMRWLVVIKRSGRIRMLKQVFHDLDLLKVNVALAGTPGVVPGVNK